MLPENRARKARIAAEKAAVRARKAREAAALRVARFLPGAPWQPHPWRQGLGCVVAELEGGARAVVVVYPGLASLAVTRGDLDSEVLAHVQAPDLARLADHAAESLPDHLMSILG